MKKIGITGNIASGKSTVERIIEDIGYKVIDADKICHDAIENNEIIIDKIKNIFKKYDIVDNQGNLSREKIGKIVFSSKSMKKQLESILHPYVIQEIEKFFIENQHNNLVFASIPLLFEINMENIFDKIIFVSCDENIRLERLIKRNNLSKEEALKRICAQDKEDDKIQKSDFVINNNKSIEELYADTISVIKKL